MQVVKQKRPLGIANTERLSFHLRIDVTIRYENVGPAVVVVVEKLRAKTEIWIADGSDPRRTCHVGELAVVVVVGELWWVVGKISLHYVRPSVAIVIGRGNANASLFASVGTVGHASLGADFGESTGAVVVIEQARRRVVRDVEIEAPVFVIVQPQDSEAVVAFGINAELLRDIGESAVTVVVVKTIARALQSARPAIYRDAPILAEETIAELRQVVDIQVDVVRDIEIEVAIVVVVAYGRAGSPPLGVGDAGLRGDVSECAVVIVAVKSGNVESCDVDVLRAVVV